MKSFIALVLGVIAVGLVLIAGVVAFAWPMSSDVVVHSAEDMGLIEFNAHPSPDQLAIQIIWTAARPDITTYTIERSLDPAEGNWEEIVTVEPGSGLYVDSDTVEYLDENVEHRVTYYYRVQMSDPDGGSGMTAHSAVTAVRPSSQ